MEAGDKCQKNLAMPLWYAHFLCIVNCCYFGYVFVLMVNRHTPALKIPPIPTVFLSLPA